jgi:GT2 family glycosyltransferase
MLEKIRKYQRSASKRYAYSVLIPSWNNVAFLKSCIESLRKHSALQPQIIVCVNEGKDGTPEWLESEGDIDYIHAETNIGVCYGLNACRSLIRSDYVVFLNDDMFVLPGWDQALFEEIEKLGTKEFMLSSTVIEPFESGNPASMAIVRDYGHSPAEFAEDRLLADQPDLVKADWSGASWPPNIVHLDLWDLTGGYSVEFSPGMYSDPDFSRKLWEAGVRVFIGKGNSLVYHFGSKSTGRIRKNDGRKTFLRKWGITARTFYREYLRMGTNSTGRLPEPQNGLLSVCINRIKRILNS